MILLPLITLNMLLLPLIDLIILIFIIICCILHLYKSNLSLSSDVLFDNQNQQQYLIDNLRSTIEKTTCIKCYSKFLQQNRNLLQDTDPYTKLHSRFFSHNLISSARPSITPPHEKRKYSTASYENIQIIKDVQSNLRASYPCQTPRSFVLNKTNRFQQDFPLEQRIDFEKASRNNLFLQTTLLKLKHKRSLCHLCYRLLLLFLLKYALFTLPQHCIQMTFHSKQFYEYILKNNTSYNSQFNQPNELTVTICRLFFLFARFGDSLLLTSLPSLIKKYFPCWCHFNSKLFRQQNTFQRPSHQILMKNTDSSTNEPLSVEDLSNSNDLSNQQDTQQRRKTSIKQSSRIKNRRFRLRFQFIPIWSKRRQRLFRENC
jgi:hypothetical protein